MDEIRAATSKLKVPVRTTNAVKEPHLRGKLGVVLVDHKFTDMQFSFMVDIGPDHGLLQCGAFEIEALDPTDPDYQEATNTP